MQKQNILLIEDDDIDKERVARYLSELYTLEWAETAAKGVAACRDGHFDAVLLDYRLPDKDGIDILPDLLESRPFVPVIFLTGEGNEMLAVESLERGASDYIPKDRLTEEALHRALEKNVERALLEKQIEEQRLQIRESEERYRSVFENSAIGNAMIDLEGQFVDVNQALCDMLAYERDEVLKMSWHDTLLPKYIEESKQQMKCLAEEKTSTYFFELPHRAKTGSMVWTSSSAVLIRDIHSNPKYIVIGAVDITERRKAERQRDQFENDLLNSNRDLEQFAYVASHDLQEPLRVITNFSTMLKRQFPQGKSLDDKAHQYIDFMVEASKRQRALIDSLLDFSRVNRKGKKLSPLSLNEVLEEVQKHLSGSIEDRNVDLVIPKLPDVCGDFDQLSRVFQNLIGNSIKFCPPDRNPRVEITYRLEKSVVHITVADNGIGFEEEFAERIFEVFERLHARDEYPGTGIGLSICQRIIERHKGKIWATSQIGQGAEFHFDLKHSTGNKT